MVKIVAGIAVVNHATAEDVITSTNMPQSCYPVYFQEGSKLAVLHYNPEQLEDMWSFFYLFSWYEKPVEWNIIIDYVK